MKTTQMARYATGIMNLENIYKKWKLKLRTEVRFPTNPNKNNIEKAATMDNPAPESDASVKSLGIFLIRLERKKKKKTLKW